MDDLIKEMGQKGTTMAKISFEEPFGWPPAPTANFKAKFDPWPNNPQEAQLWKAVSFPSQIFGPIRTSKVVATEVSKATD